ncbi:MAG: VCBS repeat-containing protein [Erythrobacter sp.]|nr:VCBS repeat-containing protein [Erythrobacter sp.]
MNSESVLTGALAQPAQRPRDWRLGLVIVLTIALAVLFWSGSRYPALQEKALMGGDTPLSGLSFDIAVEVIPGSGFLATLWANTANWIVTNLKGMTFGVLFGAMALTLLSLIQKRSFRNGFANSALGVVIGAPLGVCVNCAVPIALGLHAGRLRLETTLSAMLASPTLNVIVVTMSFALLPVQVAAVKLLASLAMVLVGVPLLCRYVLKDEVEATRDARAASAVSQKLGGLSGWLMRELTPREFERGAYGPLATLVWFAKNYSRNFLYVFVVTVPMMFLAAVLGALFVDLLRPSFLVGVLPAANIPATFLAMVLLALFFSWAPAPISLDVILTAVLLGLGMTDHYGAVVVVALGSFSVYAFIILWRAISLRTAMAMWLMVVAAAVGSGMVANRLAGPVERWKLDEYRAILAGASGELWPAAPDTEEQTSLADLRPLLDAQRVTPQPLAFTQDGDVPVASLASLPLATAAPAAGDGPVFTRVIGRDLGIGITEPLHSLGRTFFHLFEGGVAAGDIHGDGWPDLVLRKSNLDGGLAVYANVGGRFVRQAVDLGPLAQAMVHVVALADLDGDGALDLVVTTEHLGNRVLWNRQGDFDFADSLRLPGDEHALAQSLAFADFNRDGRLDLVLGNAVMAISAPGLGPYFSDAQRNQLLINQGNGQFEAQSIEQFPGQTLTMLAADFDRNGTIDLLEGDDVNNTDEFALFDSSGQFTIAQDQAVPFPARVRSSMSYSVGDYNNDLVPDYYGGQIATTGMARNSEQRTQNLRTLCAQIGTDSGWSEAETNRCVGELTEISQLKGAYASGLQSGCERMRDGIYRLQCAARALTQYYNRHRQTTPDHRMFARCQREFARLPRMLPLCDTLLLDLQRTPSIDELDAHLGPTHINANVLLRGRPQGGFVEESEAQGVRWPGWTWDARFGDLDQDGWQDLLVLTGYWARAPEANQVRLYHNRNGQFEEAGETFGLADPIPSLSVARFDFDRDGDVDLVRSLSGPNVIALRNDHPRGRGLWVHLRQPGGNRLAVGATVTICTDGETQVRAGSCQLGQVAASGGFQSFDPQAAHFGLGQAREVSLIVVDWPNGGRSVIRPQGLTGGEVVVTRAG